MYRPVGIEECYETPSLMKWVDEITSVKATGKDGESAVVATLKNLGTPSRPIGSLMPSTLYNLTGPGFDEDNPARRALIQLIWRFLSRAGLPAFKTYPRCYNYRQTPLLTLEELVFGVMDARFVWPTFASLGITRPDPRLPELWDAVEILIEKIKEFHWVGLDVLRKLRSWCSHLGWQVARGGVDPATLTDQELSFLMAYSFAFGTAMNVSGGATVGPPQGLVLEENKDITVAKEWGIAQKVGEGGPFLRFAKMFRFGAPEDMVVLWLHHIPMLTFSTGFKIRKGPFEDLTLNPDVSFPWTFESQLQGLMERYNPPTFSRGAFRVSATGVLTGMDDRALIPYESFDLKGDVRMHYPQGAQALAHEYVVRWTSPRTLKTRSTNDDGVDTRDLLLDLAYKNAQLGDNKVGNVSIPTGVLDLENCSDSFKALFDEDPPTTLKVFFPAIGPEAIGGSVKKGSNSVLKEREVDLTTFYKTSYGDMLVKPPLHEAFVPTRALLEVERPAAEQEICTQIGLAGLAKMKAMECVRICYNEHLLRRLFGVSGLTSSTKATDRDAALQSECRSRMS